MGANYQTGRAPSPGARSETGENSEARPVSAHHSPEWFDPSPSYTGVGVVELGDPAAVLEGKATAHVDDRGLVRLSVEIERMNGTPPAFLTLNDLITRECRVPENGGFRTTRHVANPCTNLVLDCPNGLLRLVEAPPAYKMTTKLITEGVVDPKVSLEFVLRTADFSASGNKPPAFWVLPLNNLVIRYGPRDESAHSHPLFFEDAKRNGSITFRRFEHLGFIAPLSDSGTRQRDLKEGRLRRTITAVAVGTLDDALRQAGELAWLRLRHSFEVLSLCSLSPVGVPWTEIRAADGGLLRRLHLGAQVPAYVSGSPPIDEFWARDTGSLVSAALSNDAVDRPFFWSALAKVVRSGERDAVIELRLEDVFIALDTLCDAYETKSQARLSKLLPKPLYAQVLGIVNHAAEELRALAPTESDERVMDVLQGVGNRVQATAFRTELGFAQALLRLMDRFELADRIVIENHFPTDGHSGQSPIAAWTSLVSKYRGIVIHNGCFKHIALERHDHPDKVLAHLRDVLIRLVLIAVGYEGGYFPEMFDAEPPRSPNWVTADTPLEDLGYFEGLERPWPRPVPELSS